MNHSTHPPQITLRGSCIATMYALVAQRLSVYYEHEQNITQTQATTLAAEWARKSGQELALNLRKQLADASEQLATQIIASLSRPAGLNLSHEMQESLDSRYHSEITQPIMAACEEIVSQLELT